VPRHSEGHPGSLFDAKGWFGVYVAVHHSLELHLARFYLWRTG
jgi:hypothetical protein